MILARAFALACALGFLLANAPKEDRICPACEKPQDSARQTCTICLTPDPPRPTGSEGMGR